LPAPRTAWALVAALAALLVPTPSPAASRCSSGDGYTYAGLESASRANGIAATISSVSLPRVEGGHAAAWIGVGGSGAGPNGADEWLQVGLSAFPGSSSALYYELKLPGRAARYVEIRRNVAPRERHRLAVLELASRPGWWQVLVDGRRVAAPARLPGSHGAWEPIAVAESWDGGVGACNSYAYSFEGIALATAPGDWHPITESYVLQDPGYRIVRRGGMSFLATSRS